MAEPASELSRLLSLGAIPAAGREERVRASPAECAALAERYMIPGVEALDAALVLVPARDGAIRATGRLAARVVQVCVVTLDPIVQLVDAPIDLRFCPPDTPLSDDPEGPDEIEITGSVIDIGEAVAEQLSLALDPYPRTPGVTLPAMDDEPPEAEEKPHPFAALSGRKRPS